jgi:Trk K+ transport system NAD-binding subunit
MNSTIVIIGGNETTGETLATQITGSSLDVVFLGEDDRAVERTTVAGVDARVADPGEPGTLDSEEIDGVGTAIVATHEDSRNLLVAQRFRIRGAERVIVLVNDPKNIDAFAEAGVEPVCAATVLSSALDAKRRRESPTEQGVSEAPGADSTKENETSNDESSGNRRLRSDGGRS